MNRQQHVCSHSDREATVGIIGPQPHFESFDIPFGATDISLRRKSTVSRAVENRSGAFFAGG